MTEYRKVPVRGGHVVVDDDAADATRPPVLLVAGTACSMDFWRPDLCAALRAAGLRVIRFDQRDTGMASADPAGAPSYELADLVDDAVAVLDALDVDAAHWVGFSQGGWVAQLAALHHPRRVASLALIASRPVAHGPNDTDLPEVSSALMATFTDPNPTPPPAPGDEAGWIDYLVDGDRPFASARVPFDVEDARALAVVVVNRTRDLGATMVNHPIAPQGDRWRERLGTIQIVATVVHGQDDPLFPPGNGAALAAELPDATLHLIPQMGHELPARVRPIVAALITDTVRRAETAPPTASIDAMTVHISGSHLDTMPGTEVRDSQIHGRGLFATERHDAGARLGLLDGQVVDTPANPGVVDALEWNALTPTSLLVRPIRTSYGFMNHSDHPNATVDADGRSVRALQTIEAGDEVTIDYRAQPVPDQYLRSSEMRRLRAAPRGPRSGDRCLTSSSGHPHVHS